MSPAIYSSCRPLLHGYFHVILTLNIFSFGEQFFEDQIRRPGIRIVPQNSYAIHKILRRGPPV